MFGPRLRIFSLTLLLAIGHLALVSHVTAHFEPEWEECELCVSQAKPLAAIPAAEHAALCGSQPGILSLAGVQRAVPKQTVRAYRQRAPPASSS